MDQALPWNGSCIRCKAGKFRLGMGRRLRFTPWCWGSCVWPISRSTAHQVGMARVRTSQSLHLPWRTTLTTYIFISPLLEESPDSSVSSQSTLLKPWRRTDLHFMVFLVLNNCPSDIGCCALEFLPHRNPRLQEIQRGLNSKADHWLDSSNLIYWFSTALLKIITIIWFAWSHCLHGKHFLVGECRRLGNTFQSKQIPNKTLLVNLLHDPINLWSSVSKMQDNTTAVVPLQGWKLA